MEIDYTKVYKKTKGKDGKMTIIETEEKANFVLETKKCKDCGNTAIKTPIGCAYIRLKDGFLIGDRIQSECSKFNGAFIVINEVPSYVWACTACTYVETKKTEVKDVEVATDSIV